MNQTLSDVALRALTARGFETARGYCSRFARQCDEAACGDERHNNQWRTDASPSAKKSAIAFRDAGLGFNYTGQPLQIGDILFKTEGSGGFGHVGILTPRGVAENSSYHAARNASGDARGLRSLAQFGAFQIVARLPDPKHIVAPIPIPVAPPKAPVWTLANHPIPEAFWHESRVVAPVAEVLKMLGLVVQADGVNANGGDVRAWKEKVSQ